MNARTLLPVAGLAALLSIVLPAESRAQDRVTLGWGRMFSNDALGDGHDRWRTGSYTVSRVRGPFWSGALPATPGEILEFRLRAETIAPANLVKPAPDDRRYAGVLTFGMHTHFDWKGIETSLGADIAVTGPQNGISDFQSWVHDWADLPSPETATRDQIGNGGYLTVVAEIGRSFDLGANARVRPFLEAQAGLETFVRVGGDLTFGEFGRGSLMLRENATGQRYRAVEGDVHTGTSFTLGADIAQVFDSVLLPEGGAAVLDDTRARVRAGMQWQGERASLFYGVTYLGEEFETQPEGQVIGSINLDYRF